MPTLLINRDLQPWARRDRNQRIDADDYGFKAGCLPTAALPRTPNLCAPAHDYIDPIPRSKWKDLINRLAHADLHTLAGDRLPPHDQGRTNLCWAHGSVRTVEYAQLYETNHAILRSAESVGVPVTGGVNRGGYPEEALARLISHGACRQDLWPKNSLKLSHWNDTVADDAQSGRVIRWLKVESWEMQVTLGLHRIPVAIGLGWWRHLVCQVNPVILPDGSVGIGCDNSHGAKYGDNGYFLLDEASGTADIGAFAPLTVNWSSRQDTPYASSVQLPLLP